MREPDLDGVAFAGGLVDRAGFADFAVRVDLGLDGLDGFGAVADFDGLDGFAFAGFDGAGFDGAGSLGAAGSGSATSRGDTIGCASAVAAAVTPATNAIARHGLAMARTISG